MKIHYDIQQGTPEWFEMRLGSVGGSSVASAVAGGQGKMRKQLMYRLAGEILSNEKYEGYKNAHMERGNELEDDARQTYAFINGVEVQQVGLFEYGNYQHFSPDAIMDDGGIIEIKCTIPSVHIETILGNNVPAAYRKQVQWGLRERDYCDFISYSPTVSAKPIWVKRVKPDKKLIADLIDGVNEFVDEMLKIVEKIKNG